MKGVGADHPYWEALRDGRVSQQQCSDCQQWHWPAVYRCSHCGSWEQQWHEVEPRGRIYSWTTACPLSVCWSNWSMRARLACSAR